MISVAVMFPGSRALQETVTTVTADTNCPGINPVRCAGSEFEGYEERSGTLHVWPELGDLVRERCGGQPIDWRRAIGS